MYQETFITPIDEVYSFENNFDNQIDEFGLVLLDNKNRNLSPIIRPLFANCRLFIVAINHRLINLLSEHTHLFLEMLNLLYVILSLNVVPHKVEVQSHMYYMDRTNNAHLAYDCFYFDTAKQILFSLPSKPRPLKWSQIIPYCVRPLSESREVYHEIKQGTISAEFTFETLRNMHVGTNDLLQWSASIELVERYDAYLSLPSNVSSKFEMFYNCSPLWFGIFCQYSYNVAAPFNQIVSEVFGTTGVYKLVNMTCYIHLECNRGPAPACLDWREVCDGKVDCIGNDADEIGCFELEMNECEENEFRCHIGTCIPEAFIGEGSYNSGCFDRPYENNGAAVTALYEPYALCLRQPLALCEERDYVKPQRSFVCGDGEYSSLGLFHFTHFRRSPTCTNWRDYKVKQALFSYAEHPDMPYECWFLLRCATDDDHGLACNEFCGGSFSGCNVTVTQYCPINYVVFPQRPILQGHVLLVYTTNKTIYFIEDEVSIFPDYVCYDAHKCPFLPSRSLLDINGTICRPTTEFGLHHFIDIVNFFRGCLTVVENQFEINPKPSFLFQCPGTTKFISKHRVLDGVHDCYLGADENNVDACQWNHKHRLKCSSEDKCISDILVRNFHDDCAGGDDELLPIPEKLTFQKFCNGYTHVQPSDNDPTNETDETHCDDWPCNNLYTRCDGAWNCLNGSDELNCGFNNCPSDTHECISVRNKTIICLPSHQADDGIIDCLGSADERAYCRSQSPESSKMRYECYNEKFCTFYLDPCTEHICGRNEAMDCSQKDVKVLQSLLRDDRLRLPLYNHFMLESEAHKSSSFRAMRETVISPTISMFDLEISGAQSEPTLQSTLNSMSTKSKIEFTEDQIVTCNRGIPIYAEFGRALHCLCPPSYYGDRCQFQSQRVSLTIQFSLICDPNCHQVFLMIIMLIDQDDNVHDFERLTYTAMHQCNHNHFVYLLYRSRAKDMTKSYHIRIDAYNKRNLVYHSSWILPIKFLVLPVNKVAAHLSIPSYPMVTIFDCPIFCGHGQCFTYVNDRREYFCRCHSGWSGVNCTVPYECDCSLDSLCVQKINNQSICVCPSNKYGPRCRLESACREGICKNGGICIADDERVSSNTYMCLCLYGFSGKNCEVFESRIDVSFDQIAIPRSLLIHLFTLQTRADPLRNTISVKIPVDQDMVTTYTSVPFHMIMTQISDDYYLSYVSANYTYTNITPIEINLASRCVPLQELVDHKTFLSYSLLHRVKHYHSFCGERSDLKCFHDCEEYICLCNDERFANCLKFEFNLTYTCTDNGVCLNDGQCFKDRSYCPHSVLCVCKNCFYGGKCQFTTKGFGLSLDAILGFHIRLVPLFSRQPIIVKISIALAMLMLVIGLINSSLTIMIFRRKRFNQSGCGRYLLFTSIASLCTTLVSSSKFFTLLLSQMSIITNMTILHLACITNTFLLRLSLMIVDWLNAAVAVDRALIVIMGKNFRMKKSREATFWVTVGILIVCICSILHDLMHTELINDEAEKRRWCLVQYSSELEVYNSVINVIHFFVPFVINFSTAIIIIINTARRRSVLQRDHTYRQHLSKQLFEHKHLIISCLALVLLATPRLIISFVAGCMKSTRNPSPYLAGYFISLTPPCLTFIIFVLPSKTYMTEFHEIGKQFRRWLRKN